MMSAGDRIGETSQEPTGKYLSMAGMNRRQGSHQNPKLVGFRQFLTLPLSYQSPRKELASGPIGSPTL